MKICSNISKAKLSQRGIQKESHNLSYTPSSKDMLSNTKYGGRTRTIIRMKFLKKIPHLQSLLKIVILKENIFRYIFYKINTTRRDIHNREYNINLFM
jgi:hypothetical protein